VDVTLFRLIDYGHCLEIVPEIPASTAPVHLAARSD
jgi:hypothetical protein